jgi:hypothetical protein
MSKMWFFKGVVDQQMLIELSNGFIELLNGLKSNSHSFCFPFKYLYLVEFPTLLEFSLAQKYFDVEKR